MRIEEDGAAVADSWPGGGGIAATPADASAYWRFYQEVAAGQLADWAPPAPARVLDVSARHSRFAEQLTALGHEVVHVVAAPPRDAPLSSGSAASGRLTSVVADPRSLGWLGDGGFDAVLAESRALSQCLAAEVAAEDLLRVLRPGGRLLLVVESLLLGLARLADRGRWAELADVPAADVVLIPDDDGSISRCFWSEELRELLGAVGFEVDWVRPRSVLAPAAVERALAKGGESALSTLVRTELALAREHEGDSSGMHLVASARKPS
jgi:SAM-dependent methyltransferase